MISSDASIRPERLSRPGQRRQGLELEHRVSSGHCGGQHLSGQTLVGLAVVRHAGVVAQLVGRDQHGPFVARLGEEVSGLGHQLPPGFQLAQAPRQEASEAELHGGAMGGVRGTFEDLIGAPHGPHSHLGVGVGAVVNHPVRGEGHDLEDL